MKKQTGDQRSSRRQALRVGAALALAGARWPARAAAQAAAPITLRVWTWYPDARIYAAVVERFEALNPDVRIQLTLMDNRSLQEKVPLALTTGEDVDVVGIQPEMGPVVRDHLLDLAPLLDRVRPGWRDGYAPADLAESMRTTGGMLKYLTLIRIGSMLVYYNADLFERLRLAVPQTLDEFIAIARRLQSASPGILPVALNGRDSWTMNEVLWTLLSQQGDYYERFAFEGATLDAPPVVEALRALRRWFDQGVLSLDLLDFDYGRSQQLFTSGRAATYIQGSWEGWLLSPRLRSAQGLAIGDVGAFALPLAANGLRAGVRSYVEVGAGISRHSRHPEAAARWIDFVNLAGGPELIASRMVTVFGKTGCATDPALLDRPAGAAGYRLMRQLIGQPLTLRLQTAELQRYTGFDRAITRVIHHLDTPEQAAQALQRSWLVHRRKTRQVRPS